MGTRTPTSAHFYVHHQTPCATSSLTIAFEILAGADGWCNVEGVAREYASLIANFRGKAAHQLFPWERSDNIPRFLILLY